jgi:hypothetical protein
MSHANATRVFKLTSGQVKCIALDHRVNAWAGLGDPIKNGTSLA